MTYRQLIDYFGGVERAADALGLTHVGVRKWAQKQVISNKQVPWQWQCAAEIKSGGDLIATLGPWEKQK